jgi:hypothetical protein
VLAGVSAVAGGCGRLSVVAVSSPLIATSAVFSNDRRPATAMSAAAARVVAAVGIICALLAPDFGITM